jgi:hypothetical protein
MAFGGPTTLGNTIKVPNVTIGPGFAPPGMFHPETRLQHRLDDMSRQIEEMQKSLEQLRQKNAKPAKPQPEKSKAQPAPRPDRA